MLRTTIYNLETYKSDREIRYVFPSKSFPGEYDAFQCSSAHCIPCSIRFPSCSGLPDGLNSWSGREWSPYYVMCEEERVTFQGECVADKSAKVFHPEQKQCVILDEKMIIG